MITRRLDREGSRGFPWGAHGCVWQGMAPTAHATCTEVEPHAKPCLHCTGHDSSLMLGCRNALVVCPLEWYCEVITPTPLMFGKVRLHVSADCCVPDPGVRHCDVHHND